MASPLVYASYLAVPLVIVGALYGLQTFGGTTSGETPPTTQDSELDTLPLLPAESAALEVRTITAKLGTLSTVRQTAVTIAPEKQTAVSARADGQVLEVLKRQDMLVENGEIVVRLGQEQLDKRVQDATFALENAQARYSSAASAYSNQQSQASTAVRSAEASLAAAQEAYLESQDLFTIGAISKLELGNAETAVLGAEAELSRVRATYSGQNSSDLELLELAVQEAQRTLDEAQSALQSAALTSPLGGEIVKMNVVEGDLVTVGQTVFVVATTRRQLATHDVPLEVARRLERDRTLTLRYGGAVRTAEVISVSTVHPATQLVRVTARLEPSQNPIPNGTVLDFSYQHASTGGIILPAAAILHEPGRRFVYVVADGKARRRDVEILGERGEEVALLGIGEGARVIYPLPVRLRAGQQVRVAGNL